MKFGFILFLVMMTLVIDNHPAHADCDSDLPVLTEKVKALQASQTKSHGLFEEGKTAMEMGDEVQTAVVNDQLRRLAYGNVRDASEGLEIIKRMDAEPDNCGVEQSTLGDIKKRFQHMIQTSKSLIKSLKNYSN